MRLTSTVLALSLPSTLLLTKSSQLVLLSCFFPMLRPPFRSEFRPQSVHVLQFFQFHLAPSSWPYHIRPNSGQYGATVRCSGRVRGRARGGGGERSCAQCGEDICRELGQRGRGKYLLRVQDGPITVHGIRY